MTIPYLQNCDHQAEGWCLECVRIMGEEQEMLLEIAKNGSNLAMMAFEAKRKARDLNDELQDERSSSVKLIRTLEDKCRQNFHEGRKSWQALDAQTAELGRLRKANDEKDALLKKLQATLKKIVSAPYSIFFCGDNFSAIKDLLREFPASADNGCSVCHDPDCKTPNQQH